MIVSKEKTNRERKMKVTNENLKLIKTSDIHVREVEWLRYPYIPYREEIFAAAKRKQISQRTVNEAKKNIDGIETRKVGAKWVWSIPNEDCNIAEVSYGEG